MYPLLPVSCSVSEQQQLAVSEEEPHSRTTRRNHNDKSENALSTTSCALSAFRAEVIMTASELTGYARCTCRSGGVEVIRDR